MNAPRTILEHLRHRAQQSPDALHGRYVHGDRAPDEQTYGQLEARTRQFAAALARLSTPKERVVLVILQHHPDMLPVFYGAMWLGAIPAFLPFPTGRLHIGKYFSDLRGMIERTQPHAIVTYRELAAELQPLLASIGNAPAVLLHEDVAADAPMHGDPVAADPEDVALIQYSSGSTGLQKGAALSHRAILAECDGVGDFFGMGADDHFVTWVPLYHDWGLVCDAIHPLVLGAPFTLMSPIQWVGRPASVFEVITKYKATVYWHPNFAFNFMTNRVKESELVGIDLSSLRLCGNGAEPCLYESHEMFARRFAKVGFRREALGIVYGMAEVVNSVIGAGGTRGRGAREPILVDVIDRKALQEQHKAVPVKSGASVTGAGSGAASAASADGNVLRMLGVGRGFKGTSFRIVDDHNVELPDRTVGEISILSRCLFHGYYNNPEVTAQKVKDGWYLSGDLGYRADGVLYVTGRKSDLIIIGGENIYPQDIEYMVAEHPQVVAGRVAAIGVEDEALGTQKLIVIAECKSDDPEVHRDIMRFVRREVSSRLNVRCDKVCIAPHKWLFKTSSGKIARLPNLARLHEIENRVSEPG
jgi:fatty-acyl-CoA synthase